MGLILTLGSYLSWSLIAIVLGIGIYGMGSKQRWNSREATLLSLLSNVAPRLSSHLSHSLYTFCLLCLTLILVLESSYFVAGRTNYP